MSAGKIIYQFYYKPVGLIRQAFKTGVWRTAEINRCRRQMKIAAARLHEVCYPCEETFTVYFLTGKKYWFQTAFCLYSLQQSAGTNIHAYLVDDGSFDEELENSVKSQFPTTTTVIRSSEILRRLDNILPESDFPVLRRRRLEYPHLRKLTDVHVLPGEGPKLVLDSDMLFLRQPDELLHWLRQPTGFLFMRDVVESYGYTSALMKELTGSAAIPERLNVGVAGVASSAINWKKLEFWTDELLKREGSSYLQEQALTAMLAANRHHLFLPDATYKVCPSIQQRPIPETLHHYVAESKYDYFVKGWKLISQK
ncbi:MAG: glycosyl transferase [Chitinophagaceae bacterium]|nr:MAG: glycosyl transferase [Chitinophagaceae bacterium]